MDIIYRDSALLVLNKPSGLLAVPGRGSDKQDCVATRVQARHPEARVVHRLDMATSGVMLMARGTDMQRAINQQFAMRVIRKHYVAVVHGRIREKTGIIELPLGADWPNRPRQQVDFRHGKAAFTCYTVLEYDAANDCTRVCLQPHTGRSHQLRVHMLALGHPIVGDALYATAYEHNRAARLLLHASTLTLRHPLDGKMHAFYCQTPF